MAVAAPRRAPVTTETRTEKGMSLARAPALVLGSILLAAGLYCLYKEHTFPPFSNLPSGRAPVEGKVFGVFGANGWTGMLTAVGGGLLLFGAAQHLVAKTMSLIVGLGLGAAAVIALISGDVLGMAAANHMTELAWGIAAAILLFNTLVPRRRRQIEVADETGAADGGPAGGYAARRRAVPAPGEPDGTETRARQDDTADTRVAHDQAQTRPLHDDTADTRVHDDQAETERVSPEGRRPGGSGGAPAA
jgi:hypothetical protein